ncbi:MAG: 3-phosphoshikimate 1-carboxyvinyltransferase [Actinomycetota bacterium]|nr:3-phosphoshikimate 1-carboxyvinyltransferase [Actinomycetota bacterium]
MLLIDSLVVPPDVTLDIPGSKSITNRALIVAALADGESVVSGALFSQDTLVMMDSLRKLGAEILPNHDGSSISIRGVGGVLGSTSDALWVHQSGTTARFCLPLAALSGENVKIDGDKQIKNRPHAQLCGALEALGVQIEYLEEPNTFPMVVNGRNLKGGQITLDGGTSSQFISALLLAAPCFPDDLEVHIKGDLVSKPYVDMTVAVMKSFGAEIYQAEDRKYVISPTGYRCTEYVVEPDASAASYFFAAAAVSGGSITVNGLGSQSIQGDIQFTEILEKMGAEIIYGDNSLSVVGTGTLNGVDVSMKEISDTVPTLAAIAPFASGVTNIRDVAFIAQKESDRIAALIAELRKVGIKAEKTETGMEIHPGEVEKGTIHTYDDHRIAMAFSILGLAASGITLDFPQCVGKTFPTFFDVLDQVRSAGDATLSIIAIDGPAGSGKSTLAKQVADQLGLGYLDTGAMYRSVAAVALTDASSLDDEAEIASIAERIKIEFENEKVYVDGKDLTEVIRSPDVNAAVSQVAANPGVRSIMRRQQRSWARVRGGGVLEGRDIGSVVFPHARLKVYVTATAEERARRRSLESGRAVEDITEEILQRDTKDSTRGDSPLVADEDAVIIDTTGKTIQETSDYIEELFRR